jgi:hypothetical protein
MTPWRRRRRTRPDGEQRGDVGLQTDEEEQQNDAELRQDVQDRVV